MIKLKASLLGPPKIFLDGVEVSFPLRKSAVLFFYLLIHRLTQEVYPFWRSILQLSKQSQGCMGWQLELLH